VIPPRYHRSPRLAHPPRISLVTPVFDGVRFVEHTVRSVIEQDYDALEYLIQDGGSSDGTLEVLARYRHATAGLESEPDAGQANAINRGLTRASGEILAYLNADDVLLPGTLHYVAAYLERHPDVDVVYGHRVLIDEANREIGRWVLPLHDDRALSWADYVPQETLFWRRRIWERVGACLDETFQFAMDWDLLLRFRDAGARFVRLPRFLGAFRVHPDQKSTSRIADLGAAEMARLRERVHGRPVSTHEIARALRGYHVRHVACQKLYRLGVLRY
jgi:glycosyltransferase involved in cell wall biosynthesis